MRTIVPKRHSSSKWEEPKVVGDPMKSDHMREFVKSTEGRENKPGAVIGKTRGSLSAKELQRQTEAWESFKKKGYRVDN